MIPDDEILLTPEEIARQLALERGAAAVYELSRKRSRDPLPVYRVGKYLRAKPSELALWLERQRIKR